MERFTNFILPYVPGCPTPLIEAEVLRTAIQFCKDSWIWQLDEEHTVLDGNSSITLSVTSGAATTGCQISIDGTGFNEYTRSGAAVTLDDARTADTDFDTTVFLKPAMDATSLPDFLYNDWHEAITAGAKATLMLMPGKPWSNAKMGAIYNRTYLHELGKAKIQARKTNDQTRLMVKQRTFV